MPPKGELSAALRPFGFRNPERVWKDLSPFGQSAFDRAAWAELLLLLLPEFSKSADPDLSAAQFASFAEASFHRSQLFKYLVQSPAARQVLCRVFGLSPSLGLLLRQEPGLLYWLFDEDGLYAKFPPEKLAENLRRETETTDDTEGKLNALRRVKRRQMLRIGARDLMGLSDVKDLTLELAGLADALLEGTLQIGKARLAQEKGVIPPGLFVAMGMGKLGGRELNYNSDIDLLFIYDCPLPEGPEREKAHRFFNDLAEWIIQAMTEPTSLGNLFRVDMRLRPEGLGDMAKSIDSYLEHYETRGQPWELQALLKARPCAGDLELGKRFLVEIEPLIFRKNFDSVYLQEIREIMDMIKEKMESQGRGRTQVKLGRGGIREIEFIVQYLELIHGGQHPEVRIPNSLEALETLGEKGYLLKADVQFLSTAYRFLRNVEHRLQMVHGLQTHTLPKKAAERERLARSMGFEASGHQTAANLFQAHYTELTERVRALYEDTFKIKKRKDFSAQAAQDALLGDFEGLEKHLEGTFFLEPAQAASNLKALIGRLRRSAGVRGELLWTGFIPELFAQLKKVPHPDRALNQLESFLQAASLPDLYVRYLLEKPALLKLLLELFSNSLFLSQILIAQPGNFDVAIRAVGESSPQSIQDFLDSLEERLAEIPDWEERLDLLRDTRNSEVLRVGLQDLLGKRSLFESFAELSRLAQALSRSALGVATDQMGLPKVGERPSVPKGFCLMAIGKLGAREMNYGSDLDVLFVYGDTEGKEIGFEAYLKLAETFTHAVADPTRRGFAYKVDARLRPMGREAQMTHSVEAYRQYFNTYAQPAERLAYTRAVFLAGDRDIGFQVKEEIDRFVYGRGLTRAELDSILDIRNQMEDKAKKARGLEIKVSAGGIVDIEFFVQILQVAYGKNKPLLRMPHVPTVMGYFKEEGLVPAEILDELLAAYRFYRLVEARHRMVRESADDELPLEPERLQRLAWRMGLGREKVAGDQLVERLEKSQERVRFLFKRIPEWLRFES